MENSFGFGCVGLSSQSTLFNALNLLETAFDEGITHFDTAPIYGNGYSEKILGIFVKGKREKISITTKFGLSSINEKNLRPDIALPLNYARKKLLKRIKNPDNLFQPNLLDIREINKSQIEKDFYSSLKKMRCGYFDYYLIHEGIPKFLTDEAILFLFNLKKEGYVKKIGIACSYLNYNNLSEQDIKDWDILQYENGINYHSNEFITEFSSKTHFYHSLLRGIKKVSNSSLPHQDLAGIVLAKASLQNPQGKIIFSSSKKNNIIGNIKAFTKFKKYSLSDINLLLKGAIH